MTSKVLTNNNRHNRSNEKLVKYLEFLSLFLSLSLLSSPSLASTVIDSTMCNISNIVTGTAGKAFAAFAIISLGVGFFTGKISWGLMIAVAMGIAAIFGAPTIVSTLSGQAVYECKAGATYTTTCSNGECYSCPIGYTGANCDTCDVGYVESGSSCLADSSSYSVTPHDTSSSTSDCQYLAHDPSNPYSYADHKFNMTAPTGKKWTSVVFASYGTPNGCDSVSSCNLSNSVAIIEHVCLGRTTCEIDVLHDKVYTYTDTNGNNVTIDKYSNSTGGTHFKDFNCSGVDSKDMFIAVKMKYEPI